tara:strand:- start:225 stop:458 length:234 start_codon:yes stop_codon:yes gene_type:complete
LIDALKKKGFPNQKIIADIEIQRDGEQKRKRNITSIRNVRLTMSTIMTIAKLPSSIPPAQASPLYFITMLDIRNSFE